MVAIGTHDVGGIPDHAPGVELVILLDVAAENGPIGRPVALFQEILVSPEAAVDLNPRLEGEGRRGIVVPLATAFIGVVDSLGDPDLIAFAGSASGSI